MYCESFKKNSYIHYQNCAESPKSQLVCLLKDTFNFIENNTLEGNDEAPKSSRAMSGRALSRHRCRRSSRASYWATDSEPPALPEERGRRLEVPVLRLKFETWFNPRKLRV